jgi:hypothetical protein
MTIFDFELIEIYIFFFLGLSVKERARMLTTTNPPMTSNDKKTTSPSNQTGK